MHPIAAEKYVRLTTYTKDGRAKTAPVWIADLGDGRAGFTTDADTWKVKRIRNTPDVIVQPSNTRGVIKSGTQPVKATARVVEGADYERVEAAIRAKYGWQVPAVGLMYKVAGLFGRGQSSDCGVELTFDSDA